MNLDGPRTVRSVGQELGDGVHVLAALHDRRDQVRGNSNVRRGPRRRDPLAAGASGYMLKRTPRAELLAAIRDEREISQDTEKGLTDFLDGFTRAFA